MTATPDPSPQDLQQEATGEGFDPDQTWPDEPGAVLPDDDGPVETGVDPVVE
jgi:hypothetical protein